MALAALFIEHDVDNIISVLRLEDRYKRHAEPTIL